MKTEKIKKKKTNRKAKSMNRTVKSANTVRPFSDEEEDQEAIAMNDNQGLQTDPEAEEILMMVQNLWEKKALGCLSKLDKKLLKKLQGLVTENPKNYSGKIGYLQMVY